MEGEDGDAEIDVFSSLTTNPRFGQSKTNPRFNIPTHSRHVPQEEAELNVIDDKRGKDDDGDDVDVDDDDPQGGAELGVTDDEGGSTEEGSEQSWKCPSASTISSIQVLSSCIG